MRRADRRRALVKSRRYPALPAVLAGDVPLAFA